MFGFSGSPIITNNTSPVIYGAAIASNVTISGSLIVFGSLLLASSTTLTSLANITVIGTASISGPLNFQAGALLKVSANLVISPNASLFLNASIPPVGSPRVVGVVSYQSLSGSFFRIDLATSQPCPVVSVTPAYGLSSLSVTVLASECPNTGLSTAALIGIIVSACVVGILLALIVVWAARRSREKSTKKMARDLREKELDAKVFRV